MSESRPIDPGDKLNLSLHDHCELRFLEFPEAASNAPANTGTDYRDMVLMSQSGEDPQYYILSHQTDPKGRLRYCISRYRSDPGKEGQFFSRGDTFIETDGCSDPAVPEEMADAILSGVPIPKHSSLYGWTDDGIVTELLNPRLGSDAPEIGLFPRVGIPEEAWSITTVKALYGGMFGDWFWQMRRDGKIVNLAPTLKESGELVVAGERCIAIGSTITSQDGWTLPSGTFASRPLHEAGTAPQPEEVLADDDSINLGEWFRRHSENF